MPKNQHSALDAVFADYDQLDNLPNPAAPQSITSRTQRAVRRTMSNNRGRVPVVEQLESRQLLSAASPEFDPNAVYFKTLSTNGLTTQIEIHSPADSSVISTHGYGGNMTVNHPGGADGLVVDYPLAYGNTNLFGVKVESAGKNFSEHYYYTGGQLHGIYSDAWSLHPAAGAQAWNESVPRIAAPGNIPSDVTIEHPSMQLRIENGQLVMDLVTPDSETLIFGVHHPLPNVGQVITQYVLQHGDGGFSGTLSLPILNESVNNQDSGGRTIYMVSPTGSGIVLDASTANYSNQSHTFTLIENEIPFTLPDIQAGGGNEQNNAAPSSDEIIALEQLETEVLALQKSIPNVRGITSEAILVSHQEKVTELQSRLIELQAKQNSITTAQTTTEERIASLQQTVADINEALQSQDYIQAVDALTADPSITVQVDNDKNAYVFYENMPGVLSARLLQNGGVMKTVAIPAGSGRVEVSPYGMGDYTLYIIRPDTGEILSNPYSYKVKFRGVIERYSEPSQTLTAVRANNAEPMSAEELAAATVTKAEAETEIAHQQTYLSALNEAQNTVDATSAMLHQEQIPYSRMYVEVLDVDYNRARISVRLQSPLPRVKVEVQGEPPRYLENANGIADTTITTERKRDPSYGNVEPVRITLENPETGEILDTVYMKYWQDRPSAGILTQQSAWENMETGRMVDHQIQPVIGVVDLDGPNAFVYYATPYDQSEVVIASDGIFASSKNESVGGNTSGFTSVTINPDKPTGTYTISLLAKEDGQQIAFVQVHWSQSNRTLTLTNGEQIWSVANIVQNQVQYMPEFQHVSDLSSEISNQLDIEVMTTEMEDLIASSIAEAEPFVTSLNEWNLKQAYREKLVAASPFFVERTPWVISRMTVKPDDFQAHVDALAAQNPDVNRATIEYNEYQKMIAELDDLGKRYGWEMEKLADILIEGEQIMLQFREGVYDQARIYAFETKVNENKDLLHHYSYEDMIRTCATLNATAPVRSFSEHLQALQQRTDNKAYEMVRRHEEGIRARAINDSDKLQLKYEAAILEGTSVSVEDGLKNMSAVADRTRALISTARAANAREVAAAPSMQRLRSKIARTIETSNDPRAIALRELGQNAIEIAAEDIIVDIIELADARQVDPEEEDPQVLGVNAVEFLWVVDSTLKKVANGEKPLTTTIGQMLHMVEMPESGTTQVPITITEDSMVNLWVEGIAGKDVSLKITGEDLPTNGYATTTNQGSGDSISLRLTPGNYTLTIQDNTPYAQFPMRSKLVAAPLNYNIQKFNAANIEGKISIEGRNKVMDVSLRVAEFDSFGARKTDYSKFNVDENRFDVSRLDPTKPVWVVVHGRNDKEDSSQMAELAKNLTDNGAQVVTVDWRGAASDNITAIGLHGTKWIDRVGKWVADQLQSLQFTGSKIDIASHSWGTYIANQIAINTPGGVQTIVALDPAKDSALLGSNYDESSINFATVSNHSYAFHSSFFGDEDIALTADNTFNIRAPEGYENNTLTHTQLIDVLRGNYASALGTELIDELVLDPYREHGFAVTLFSQLLADAKANPNNILYSQFSPQNLHAGNSTFKQTAGYEGWFAIDPQLTKDKDGKDWWKANTYAFYGLDKDDDELFS